MGLLDLPPRRPEGHMDLLMMRNAMAANDPRQNELGPAEHEAFVREYVGEHPISAVPMALMIPGYSAAKLMGLMGGRSQPSLQEMGMAYRGLLDALMGK